jgi:hypothetical protein
VEARSFSSTVVVKQLGISDFEGGTSMYFNNITMFSRYIGPKIWVPRFPFIIIPPIGEEKSCGDGGNVGEKLCGRLDWDQLYVFPS